MKSLVIALIATISLSAVAQDKYITVEVCGDNEASDMSMCHKVTYKDRGPIAPQAAECVITSGERTEFVPCEQVPASNGHVPAWLRKLNKKFTDHGFTAPKQDDGYSGGAN